MGQPRQCRSAPRALRRTVADNLRHLLPHHALAVADAAVRRSPGVLEGAHLVLGQQADWPYASRAWKVMPLVDGRRESALEPWSAWFMHLFGVPKPEPQVELYDVHGRFLGRTDFWWHEFGVAGEADGKTKYALNPGDNLDAAQRRLIGEKSREDGFRRTGAGVIRWGTEEMFPRPWAWAQDILRQLHAHPRGQFRGRAVSTFLAA